MSDRAIDGLRVRLRPMTTADADGPYHTWMNDPEITRYLESRFQSYEVADLAAYIDETISNPANHFFAIELVDSHRHVGNIKLGPVEVEHGRGDIGIIVGDRSVWGQGIASEAVRLLTEWAFVELGLRKVTAGAYGSNVGSVRAFERAGFHVEAVRPAHYASDDGFVDAVLLARFAAETEGM
jgi:[ribosomal protein S5]-alanine N-acetyltransferase